MKKNMLLTGILLLLASVFSMMNGCSSGPTWDFFILKNELRGNSSRDSLLYLETINFDESAGKVVFYTETSFGLRVKHDGPDRYVGKYYPAKIGEKGYLLFAEQIVFETVPAGRYKNRKTARVTCKIVKSLGKFTGKGMFSDEVINVSIPSLTNNEELGGPDSSVKIPTSFAGIEDLQNFINHNNLVVLISADETTKRYVYFKSQGSQKNLSDWWYSSEIYLDGDKTTVRFFKAHENQGKGMSAISVNDRIFHLSTDTGVITKIQFDPASQFCRMEILSEIKPSETAKMLSISPPTAENLVVTKKLLTDKKSFDESDDKRFNKLKEYIVTNKLLLVLIEPNLSEKLTPSNGKTIKFWEHKVFRGNSYYYLFSGKPEMEFMIGDARYLTWGDRRILHFSLDELQRLQIEGLLSLPSTTVSDYPKKDDLVEVMIEDSGTKFTARYGSLATVSKQLRIIVNEWVKLETRAQLIIYFQGQKIHRGVFVEQVTDGTGNKIIMVKLTE